MSVKYTTFIYKLKVCSKTGVYKGISIFVLFWIQNIDCGCSLGGGSNLYPQSMF